MRKYSNKSANIINRHNQFILAQSLNSVQLFEDENIFNTYMYILICSFVSLILFDLLANKFQKQMKFMQKKNNFTVCTVIDA